MLLLTLAGQLLVSIVNVGQGVSQLRTSKGFEVLVDGPPRCPSPAVGLLSLLIAYKDRLKILNVPP